MKENVMKPTVLISLLALVAGLANCLTGCGEPNQSQISPAYQKLPPGEGERRMKETLDLRSGKKPATSTGSTATTATAPTTNP